jgi:phosphoribosylamine--glycine ligase
MDILIVGNGAREYSIGLALKRDKNVDKIYFAKGNGATCDFAVNVDITDFEELANYVKENGIDLTIVGPEQPLVDGIVDIFKSKGLKIFGSSREASKLEGSKAFMKNFLKENSIPTAKYIETSSSDEAIEFAKSLTPPIVIKADGLCGGKGVLIVDSIESAIAEIKSMLSGDSFGDAGRKVIVEEFLDGYELSMFAICDGESYKLFPASQDHKRLLDFDKGPNTGGMGAYAPTPLIDKELYQKVKERVIEPTLNGMRERNSPFEGVLFIGLMVIEREPYVLEFNVRFGDPECEVLMPLLKTPASELFLSATEGRLKDLELEFFDKVAVGVVKASENYPYSSSTPAKISIDNSKIENGHISFAGVSKDRDGLYATGGRVLVSVGVGDSVQEARDRAYKNSTAVTFKGEKERSDIAYQALNG